MNNLLKLALKKLNATEFSQLSEEEKQTYRYWDEILAGKKITDEDVKNFFDSELDAVLIKLVSPTLSEREDVFLKMKLEFLRKVKGLLLRPEQEKLLVEQQIKAL